MVNSCWRVSSEDVESNGKVDGLLWYKDIGNHYSGEFSMAVVQANSSLEDHSQLESGPLSFTKSGPHGTIVGVYDGHGGPEASWFVNNNLVRNFKRLTSENGVISENVIRKAFAETENDFMSLVKKQWLGKPQLASTGTCCLVGILSQGLLHIANSGDSRVVLGRAENSTRGMRAIQLSQEHNANMESVREELRKQHADDPNIVVLKHKVWRVKGIIQVSRSIGDAYLKKAEFNQEPLPQKFRLREAFKDPILSSEPAISSFKLKPEDQFLIFASDGLWEQLSNQEATNIVYRFPRKGVAKKLAKMALREAARKREMRYSDLIKIDAGVRRHFHDDITVVVVFLDQNVHNTSTTSSSYSVRAGIPASR